MTNKADIDAAQKAIDAANNAINKLDLCGLNHGEATTITDADRILILKHAGFVRARKEKDNEQ